MFFEIEMTRNVVISPDKLHTGMLLKRSIVLQLIEDVKRLQATEEHGFLVAVTTLEGQGEGKIREMTGSVVFPVKFKCIVFKPLKNEVLEGEVIELMKSGLRVICGPMTELFIPHQTMKDFNFVPGENPVFKGKASHQIEKGGKIRFKILGVKWKEQNRIFQALGSLQGNYLGPTSDLESPPKPIPEINITVQPDNPHGSPTKANNNDKVWDARTNANDQGWASGGANDNGQGWASGGANDNGQGWASAGTKDNDQGWASGGANDNCQGWTDGTRDKPMDLDDGPNDKPKGWDSATNDNSQGFSSGTRDNPMELDAEQNDNSKGWDSVANDNPQGLASGANDNVQGWSAGASDNTQATEANNNPQGWSAGASDNTQATEANNNPQGW